MFKYSAHRNYVVMLLPHRMCIQPMNIIL